MPRTQAYLRWLAEYGDKPTPPAASMPKPIEKKVIDLAESFKKAYSQPRRIA